MYGLAGPAPGRRYLEIIMDLPQEGHLLRIIIGESSRHKGTPLYEWIVVKAREFGVAGATVVRGMMGYGANSRIKTTSILRLSEDLPVIIEMVDTREMLEDFLEIVSPALKEGLVTFEKMHIWMYRSEKQGSGTAT
jgi:PII-like signaling protein